MIPEPLPPLPRLVMQTKFKHDGVYWLICPECGKYVIMTRGEVAIIEPGEFYAFHDWVEGGLRIGNIEVSQ